MRCCKGIVLIVLAIVIGLIVGYVYSASRYGPVEGFYAVARAIRDLMRFDLPGTSFRRVFALARLAFKEAIRRKVLFVVGLFLVLLLLAGWYLNPESDDPARLYISFVLTATNYLILVLALFISTFSLPADIKSKTIYTIVTKPVRATEIVLGRMLGFRGGGNLDAGADGLGQLSVRHSRTATHPSGSRRVRRRSVAVGWRAKPITSAITSTRSHRSRLRRRWLDRHRSRPSPRGHRRRR